MVGPFIFFDQAGPAEFLTGQGVDVRPHPHIGLATVTYLYRGEFQHRDSLGSNQIIHPGALNWMVAGRGVTHSERTSAATRRGPHSLFGIQTWVALPEAQEDAAPSFEHHAKDALPTIEADGARLRMILGAAYGQRAPASVFSETFYVDAALDAGARLPLPNDHEDRGLYIVEGAITVAGQSLKRAACWCSVQAIRSRSGPARPAPAAAARRRDAQRAALHLVELRRLEPRADRRGQRGMAQGGMGQRSIRPAARRSQRIHTGAVDNRNPPSNRRPFPAPERQGGPREARWKGRFNAARQTVDAIADTTLQSARPLHRAPAVPPPLRGRNAARDIGPHAAMAMSAYAQADGPQRTKIVKFALRLAGALALLGGVVVVVAGCLAYSRLPGAADADALIDTIDAIAIGAFGALFGAGLIVYAGRASKRDA